MRRKRVTGIRGLIFAMLLRALRPNFLIGAVLFTAAAVSARADYASTILSLGPIGYWRFNDAGASPPLNVITNATALGAIANGVCVDNPVKGQPGIIGTCVQFLNPGAPVGYVGTKIDIPWNAALNPNPPFSIEFWARPTSLSSDSTGYCPLSNFDPNFSGASRAGWLFYVNNTGRWQWRLGNRGGYAGMITGTNGNAAPGAWQHIVATWDGVTANLYANGVLIGSGAVSFSKWVNNPQSFIRLGGTPLSGQNAEANYISANSNNGDRGYDGCLEEFAIYTNVLSPSTVAAHFAATNSGYDALILSANPGGYWPMHDLAVTPPTGPFPVVVNIGSLGAAADGTNYWGVLAAQPGPGFAGFGASSKSVFFDGDNGYCQITDAPGLHWASNGVHTNFITMAAWIKPTEKDFFRNIISHGWDAFVPGADYPETFLRISRGVGSDFTGDGNYYEVGASDGVNFYDSVLVPIPPGDIGNWVFIAGTFDGTNWNLYRNGRLAGTIPANSGSSGGWNLDAAGTTLDYGAVDVTNWWTVGSRGADPFFVGQEMSFGGSITEASIFTNSLTPSDVANLYNAAQIPPVFTMALQNPGTVFTSSNLNFSVWAEGNPALGYLWTSNGISTGVTATNYSITNIQAGTYTIAVVVTNAYGTNSSFVTFNVENAPPSILVQPISTTRIAGFPFNFSVTAGGAAPLTYYWKLGNTDVQSGAASNYTATASLANAGSYTVMVSNVTGVTVTSIPAILAVNPVPGVYGGAVLASGPMAFWRLDETNGSIAHDQVGGNDGTYFNAILGQPGYSALDSNETAAAFNGQNSYVGNISGAAINFTGHTNFTLEAWVKAPVGLLDDSTIIAKGVGYTGTPHTEQFDLDVNNGVYRFYVTTLTNATINEADATEGPNVTWQHLAAVYDDQNILGGGARSYLYVNGALEGTGPVLAAGLNGTVTPVSIGSKRTGNDPAYDGTFDGEVSQVAVYSKPLDASTIFNHYAAAYGPVTLAIQQLPLGTNITLTWPAGLLQSATNLSGPYVTITNALSPFTTNSSGASRFFRVKL